MTDREAMQIALDALESSRVFVTTREKIKHPEGTEWYDERIEALRAALAQGEKNKFNPDWDVVAVMVEEQQRMAKRIEELEAALVQGEPEPVAWCIVENGRVHGLVKSRPAVMNAEKWQPLYTAPQQREWQGLTDEEVVERANADYSPEDFARGVAWAELKLKERNV